MSHMFISLLADVKDPGTVELRPIQNSCVYLWDLDPFPPRRKVHSAGLFPAVWCQNCRHHPSESLGEDGGRIWATLGPSKASLKKERQSEMLINCAKNNRRLSEWKKKEPTCIERVRVIVFVGWAEAGQTIIRDFQNKSTVHHTIRWLEISVAADVAVVKIVHSLVETSEKFNIRGVAVWLPSFSPPQQIRQGHAQPRHMEMIHSDKCTLKALERGCTSRIARSQGNCCENTVNSFGKGDTWELSVSCSIIFGNGESYRRFFAAICVEKSSWNASSCMQVNTTIQGT